MTWDHKRRKEKKKDKKSNQAHTHKITQYLNYTNMNNLITWRHTLPAKWAAAMQNSLKNR